jgi:hypothetical protein
MIYLAPKRKEAGGDMNLQKAVENWSDCDHGRDRCLGEKSVSTTFL